MCKKRILLFKLKLNLKLKGIGRERYQETYKKLTRNMASVLRRSARIAARPVPVVPVQVYVVVPQIQSSVTDTTGMFTDYVKDIRSFVDTIVATERTCAGYDISLGIKYALFLYIYGDNVIDTIREHSPVLLKAILSNATKMLGELGAIERKRKLTDVERKFMGLLEKFSRIRSY